MPIAVSAILPWYDERIYTTKCKFWHALQMPFSGLVLNEFLVRTISILSSYRCLNQGALFSLLFLSSFLSYFFLFIWLFRFIVFFIVFGAYRHQLSNFIVTKIVLTTSLFLLLFLYLFLAMLLLCNTFVASPILNSIHFMCESCIFGVFSSMCIHGVYINMLI